MNDPNTPKTSFKTSLGRERVTPLQNAFSGALAGVTTRFVISPLDVVKIRLQIQPETPDPFIYFKDPAKIRHTGGIYLDAKYKGIFQAFKRIVQEEGLKGLWKGNLSAEYLYLTYGAVQFLAYHELEEQIPTLESYFNIHSSVEAKTFICGALAGSMATLVTYPLDLLRTRFAVQGHQKIYSSILDAVRQIAAKEGITGFYRGVWTSIIQIMPYMGIMFESHRLFKRMFEEAQMKRSVAHSWMGSIDLLSGALAGIVSKTSVMPFDVVRKRLQVQGPNRNMYVLENIPRYPRSFLGTMLQIVRYEGVLGLYKGIVPALLKAAPSSAVTFFVVGECRRWFGRYNEMTRRP